MAKFKRIVIKLYDAWIEARQMQMEHHTRAYRR